MGNKYIVGASQCLIGSYLEGHASLCERGAWTCLLGPSELYTLWGAGL